VPANRWYGPFSILFKQVCVEEFAVEAKAGVGNNNSRAASRESILHETRLEVKEILQIMHLWKSKRN
jgi:hypothetical protein